MCSLKYDIVMKYESFRLEKSHQMEKESIIATVLTVLFLMTIKDISMIATRKETDRPGTFQKKKRLICYVPVKTVTYNVVQVE